MLIETRWTRQGENRVYVKSADGTDVGHVDVRDLATNVPRAAARGGEEKVAAELSKLGPSWRVLHAVEVGENGSDIDHLVVGPPGVFTLNTKRHPGGKAWVAEHMVMVNGQRTGYLRNSQYEAQRAARLLSAASHRAVVVKAAIVFVDLDRFEEKQTPHDVHVTTRHRLVHWLRSLPAILDESTVDAIYAAARLSTTWQWPQ